MIVCHIILELISAENMYLDKLVDREFTCDGYLQTFFYIVKSELVEGVALNVNCVLCSYRVDEPLGLVELQKNEWDPVLHWIENR